MTGIKTALTAGAAGLIAAALFTMAPAAPAESAPSRAEPRRAPIQARAKAQPAPTAPTTWTSDKVATTGDIGGGVTCPRTRRKLWIEAEGWVVRKVAACR